MSIQFDKNQEKWSETALKEFLEIEKKGVNFTVYFLIGSHADDDIQVAHIAKCPLPGTVDAEEGDSSSTTVDEEWVTDHSEKVLRMLSGGISIIGMAAVCSKEVFNEQRTMLNRALARTYKMTTVMSTLELDVMPSKMGLIHVDTSLKNTSAIIIDVVNRGPDAPSRINFSKLNWVSLVSRVAVDIRTAIEPTSKDDFYAEFNAALKPWATNLFSEDTVVLFGGELREDSETIVKDQKKGKIVSSFDAEILLACGSESGESVVEGRKRGEVFEVSFDLAVRACVSFKATVKEAKHALYHHILRSLLARAALHYESMELQEEGPRASPALHQLPRAATTVLPCAGSILVYDFLFEGDSADDAIKNFHQLIGIKPSTEEVDDLWERNLSEGEVEEPSLIIQHLHKHADPSGISRKMIILAVVFVLLAFILYQVVKK